METDFSEFISAWVAPTVERRTENPSVTGSNPVGSNAVDLPNFVQMAASLNVSTCRPVEFGKIEIGGREIK